MRSMSSRCVRLLEGIVDLSKGDVSVQLGMSSAHCKRTDTFHVFATRRYGGRLTQMGAAMSNNWQTDQAVIRSCTSLDCVYSFRIIRYAYLHHHLQPPRLQPATLPTCERLRLDPNRPQVPNIHQRSTSTATRLRPRQLCSRSVRRVSRRGLFR